MLKNKIFSLILVLLFMQNPGFCTETVQDLMVKFTIAMAGVILASIIIWIGLAIYNKIILHEKTSPMEDILKTPSNIDDAIKFFINRNRL